MRSQKNPFAAARDRDGHGPAAHVELFLVCPVSAYPEAPSKPVPERLVSLWECCPATLQAPGPKLVWPYRQSDQGRHYCQFQSEVNQPLVCLAQRAMRSERACPRAHQRPEIAGLEFKPLTDTNVAAP